VTAEDERLLVRDLEQVRLDVGNLNEQRLLAAGRVGLPGPAHDLAGVAVDHRDELGVLGVAHEVHADREDACPGLGGGERLLRHARIDQGLRDAHKRIEILRRRLPRQPAGPPRGELADDEATGGNGELGAGGRRPLLEGLRQHLARRTGRRGRGPLDDDADDRLNAIHLDAWCVRVRRGPCHRPRS
jgi:hypothetical protein